MLQSAAWRARRRVRAHRRAVANECHFDLLAIATVDALAIEHFSDETHVNELGAAIYTPYLLERLGYRLGDDAS